MNVIIREGKKEDVVQVLQLVKELAEYERAPYEVTNTVEEMLRDGFDANPVYGMFVAELNDEIVGIAVHYIRYSTWKGRCLYLEDIVVKESLRGKKIGRLLFNAVALYAKEKTYAALVWQILDWNEPALNFYRKYNAQFDAEWVTGKLTLDQLANFQPL